MSVCRAATISLALLLVERADNAILNHQLGCYVSVDLKLVSRDFHGVCLLWVVNDCMTSIMWTVSRWNAVDHFDFARGGFATCID
jgi:hypothetical protein